jgi:hypothetical protein
MEPAIFVEKSRNTKISDKKVEVSATYASIKGSCPSSCPLRGDGCYAQVSYVNYTTHRLDRGFVEGMRPEAVARVERRAIREGFDGGPVPQDGAQGGRDLRMHVSGDARTKRSAAILGDAAREWRERGGGDVWTYTHAWHTVPRECWGEDVSVLGSTEDPKNVEAIREQGYAPAIVVASHPSDRAYQLEGTDTKWIPCPQQTKDIPCTRCRLCFNADSLRDQNRGIAFAAHGATRKIRKHLKVYG